ncbi:MAG: hypothetical protein JW703_01030 [Candidatus Diapherotrites archaeon]|nr:hypothetical protein [Candidatus Diapherotrites archaeon]
MKSVDAINPAFNAMKELLFPIKLKFWLKLAFVSMLGSSGGGGGGSIGNAGNTSNSSAQMPDLSSFLAQYGLIIGLIVFAVILLILVLTYIHSVFSFVFLDDLIERKSRILSSFKENMSNGFSYFLFNVFLGLISLITLLLFLSPVLIPVITGMNQWIVIGSAVLLLLLWALSFGLILGLITSFTHAFVLPLMILKKKPLMNAWSELKPLIFKEWKEILLFLIISFFLGIALAVICLILLLPLIVLGIILAVIALILGVLSIISTGNITMIAILIILAIPVMLIFAYLASIFLLPVSSFNRYYSMIFLAKIEPETAKLLEGKGIQVN